MFDLEYVVVPAQALSSQILLGDPILDLTDVQLLKQGPMLEPIMSDRHIKKKIVQQMKL